MGGEGAAARGLSVRGVQAVRADGQDGLPVRATVAHHIQHLDEHPELAYDLANGRALCEACHNKMHPEKGGKSARFQRGRRTV